MLSKFAINKMLHLLSHIADKLLVCNNYTGINMLICNPRYFTDCTKLISELSSNSLGEEERLKIFGANNMPNDLLQ